MNVNTANTLKVSVGVGTGVFVYFFSVCVYVGIFKILFFTYVEGHKYFSNNRHLLLVLRINLKA